MIAPLTSPVAVRPMLTRRSASFTTSASPSWAPSAAFRSASSSAPIHAPTMISGSIYLRSR